MAISPRITVPDGSIGIFRCLILSIAAKSSLTPFPSNLSIVSCLSVITAQNFALAPTKQRSPINSACLFLVGPSGPANPIRYAERIIRGISSWGDGHCNSNNWGRLCYRRFSSTHCISRFICHVPHFLFVFCFWFELRYPDWLHCFINCNHEEESRTDLFTDPFRSRKPT